MLGEPLQLDLHLDEHHIAEGMVRQDMFHACQFALGIDIGIAEYILIHHYSGLLIGRPYHLAPVVATRVESASIVEEETADLCSINIHNQGLEGVDSWCDRCVRGAPSYTPI